jgi:hypothetical protein
VATKEATPETIITARASFEPVPPAEALISIVDKSQSLATLSGRGGQSHSASKGEPTKSFSLSGKRKEEKKGRKENLSNAGRHVRAQE